MMEKVNNRLQVLLSFLFFLLINGCSSSSSDNVVKFFFDGVPNPDSSSENSEQLTVPDSTLNNQDNSSPRTITPIVLFHVPYQEKSCNSCHDSGISHKTMMKLPELCYQCHDDFSKDYKSLHYPVEEGDCTTCHNPHQSKNSSLLIKPTGELCEDCHDLNQLLTGDVHEGIDKDECMDCHNPHGSNDEFLLK